MAKEHTVKSYGDELFQLKSKIVEMGKEAQQQLTKAVQALVKQDIELAQKIVNSDTRVNSLQSEIDNLTVRVLAMRQPMAVDLRSVIAGLKIAAELERIADYAANIAKYVPELNKISLEMPVKSIARMAGSVQQMLEDVIAAYSELNVKRAVQVWHRDDDIDQIYEDLLGQLQLFMTKDSENVSAYTSLLFVARCCERIGDHITNIAENIYYIEHSAPYSGNSTQQ